MLGDFILASPAAAAAAAADRIIAPAARHLLEALAKAALQRVQFLSIKEPQMAEHRV